MTQIRDKSVCIRELAIIATCFFVLELALWTPPPAQIPLGICAIVAMTVATFRRTRSMRELGLDWSAWSRGTWVVVAALIAASAMLAVASLLRTLQPLSNSSAAGLRSLMYGAWAFEQQFILLSFSFVGVESALGTRKAIAVCALLFCLAHIPNPILFVATFVTGVLFAMVFARYRSVYVIAVAHAILGLTLAVTIPEELHHHMRVGWAYSQYRVPASRLALRHNFH